MIINSFEIPPSDSLLPDPIQPPYYQPPYTLVIEISDLLLHMDRYFGSGGVRYRKRPFSDYFIDAVKYPKFEVVFFTREPHHTGHILTESLDPHGSIQFKLFRESTQLINGKLVKDLSCMNRDLSKVILIDWDKNSYQLQPRNALHGIKRWNGHDSTDTDLYYLASFLTMIADSDVSDVRDLLDLYNREKDPLEAFIFSQTESTGTEADDESNEST